MEKAFVYVILGGGVTAGYSTDIEFVKRGVLRGQLCIISEELVAPYERPALSKWYLLPEGTPVQCGDVKLKVWLTAKGETISYKYLIVATGSRVTRLKSTVKDLAEFERQGLEFALPFTKKSTVDTRRCRGDHK